jgi:hypothetical protein
VRNGPNSSRGSWNAALPSSRSGIRSRPCCWLRAEDLHPQLWAGRGGGAVRPEYGLPQPYSGHMSYADWGPPPDSASGRVVVVGPRHAAFTGCLVVVTHEAVIENEEDGTEVAVCDPVDWSRCGRNCAGSMAERRTDGAHGTREVSCCSCRDDFRPPRRSIGEDSRSKRIVVMARITGGYRRVGLPESPCTKETPCLKCRFIRTRSPRQYRCSPCAMPADEALANREVLYVDQTCK